MGVIARLLGLEESDNTASNQNFDAEGFSARVRHSFEFLSFSAKEQSAAVQETMASLEEMRTMLAQTDQHVSRSQSLAEKARDHGAERLQTVEKMQQAMSMMKETNALLTELQSSFTAIKNKTRVINDIVFKTQLLSFNASIEAARAGQFGKGFSVVAEEVGRLAQMSGKASKEIDALIADSQKKAMTVVGEVVARAEEGAKISNEVIVSFHELNQAISEISRGLKAMSEASKEQLQGMEQTTIAIERISRLTEENRKNAEGIYTIAEQALDSSKSAEQNSVAEAPNELLKLVDTITKGKPAPAKGAETKDFDADDDSFRSQS